MPIQPIRPQDASGIYRRNVIATGGTPGGQQATDRAQGDAAARGARRVDSVSLSGQAQELRRVLAAIRELPDIRDARITYIREQLANGVYSRDVANIAERMIEEGVI
jgi:flagellar biosynthesis anti-sigma factor FlgM